jgi:hypothetical protein
MRTQQEYLDKLHKKEERDKEKAKGRVEGEGKRKKKKKKKEEPSFVKKVFVWIFNLRRRKNDLPFFDITYF